MKVRARAAIPALALLSQLFPAAAVLAAEPIEVVFSSTAAEQQFEVPEGVDELHVSLIGGKGGNTSQTGGSGALVEGDIVIAPGTLLFVEVAGNGSAGAGGFNGGASGGATGAGSAAGGGGGSDIRTISRSNPGSLESRLMVAAGGGGAGFGNNGGNAGAAGPGPTSGLAGTATSGGAGGGGVPPGENGALGMGGAGGAGSLAGAGGGGGLFGGGGGGQSDTFGGGGGGGGSSFTGAATSPSIGLDATGIPSITITYTPGSVGGATVIAQVTVPTSEACLELSTVGVDFGTLPLGAVGQQGSPDVVITNCSGVQETILARGTDASATDAAWTLTDAAATCADALGFDVYRLGLEAQGGGLVQLSTTNKTLQALESGASGTHTVLIDTACPGSSGGGSTMTMQIVFVATELAP